MMNNISVNPLVSIVIPTRNRWEDLQKAIDSCLKQEYKPLEILIYDDASSENIAEMVREKYSGVKIYRSETNVGQVCLRNKGFHDAKGKYIFSLDDDSYFDDRKTITKAVEILEKYPKVAAAALPYYEPKLERRYFFHTPAPGNGNSDTIWQVSNYTACAAAFRREAISDIGGYCEDFFFAVEEDDLAIRLMDRGWDIIAIPVTPLVHLFSGIRDLNRLHILGPRNSILFIFFNTPLLYFIPRIIKTALGGLWHGIIIGEPKLKLQGIIQGYKVCKKYRKKRHPVSAKTWQRFRRLLKRPEPYVPVQSK